MHGNMSGEIVVDATLPTSRIVGKHGDGAKVGVDGDLEYVQPCKNI